MSLSGPMFGPNGSTLLLNDQAVAVVVSSAPVDKVAVEVDEDTVSACGTKLGVREGVRKMRRVQRDEDGT